MPLPPPTFADGYALTTAHEVSRTVFNGIFGDIKTRIAALQSVVVAYEAIEAAGIEASLAVITDSITPQLEALADEMSAIQALIVVAEGQLLALQNAGVDAENITISDSVGLGSGLNLEEALVALKAYADSVGATLAAAKLSIADKASQAEARAGTDNAKWMTPLRVREQRLLRANVQSSNYTAVAADFGLEISCSGTFTLGLTAAATLGDGWFVWVRNAGSGVITIDPNAAETIDGFSTITMLPGDAIRISTNGVVFYTLGRKQSEELIGGVQSGTAVAALNWSGLSGYDFYRLVVWDYKLTVESNTDLELHMSTDGGATFLTFQYAGIRGAPSGVGSVNVSGQILLAQYVFASSPPVYAEIKIRSPRTSGRASVLVHSAMNPQGGNTHVISGAGTATEDGVVNYLRLKQNTGTIAAIKGQLYGIKIG